MTSVLVVCAGALVVIGANLASINLTLKQILTEMRKRR